MKPAEAGTFGWPQIVRLGLVQAALGAVVVLTTSTLNRVMVVELGLPALLPGLLVALHHVVQLLRPRMGHGADVGRRTTPWIVGGMAALALGGLLASLATAGMGLHRSAAIALAVLAFVLIGIGVSAAGTSLLVLLAQRVAPARRAGAATTVWLMMIVGFVVTAAIAGKLLDPYTPARLVGVAGGVCAVALLIAIAAVWGLEGRGRSMRAAEPGADVSVSSAAPAPAARRRFRDALAEVWAEPTSRRFTLFVFLSMLAYSAQDLILEPFAGAVHGFTPGQSTSLSAVQHGGALLGMLAAAMAGRGRRFGSLKAWQIGGCGFSALALLGLAASAFAGPAWPFTATVFALGAANGAFSIAAIASMMSLAGQGRPAREGVRMGVWGAAQAVAFGVGGVVGTGASDLAHAWLGSPAAAYASVFVFEALLFCIAARLAARMPAPDRPAATAGVGSRPANDPAPRPVASPVLAGFGRRPA